MRKEIAVPDLTRRRKRRTPNSYLPVIILVALLACVFLFVWGRLTVAVSRVQFLALQEVSQTAQMEGILLKEEQVMRAPAKGKIHFAAVDGKRLEMGALAAQVVAVEQGSSGASFNLITPSAGMFCTHLDGLESILSPANLDVLDFSRLDKIAHKQVTEGERVEKGQPVLKLIDNLSTVYLYVEAPKPGFPVELLEKPAWFKAKWDNLPLMIKLFKLVDKGDRWEGLFNLSGYPDQLVHNRKVRLSITTSRLEGFLVPDQAVVYRDGKPGIYLAVKKRAQWVPVNVEGELEGKVAISGRGLGEDTRYVCNPVLAREGSLVE
jgi:putative membrane fusion protein